MRGLFAAFVSYTVTDLAAEFCKTMEIPMNPLVLLLVSFPLSMAIYFGIMFLDDKSKGW